MILQGAGLAGNPWPGRQGYINERNGTKLNDDGKDKAVLARLADYVLKGLFWAVKRWL